MFIIMEYVFLTLILKKWLVFYFFGHFYKVFKEKKSSKGVSVLQSHAEEEVIAYCCDCQGKLCKTCSEFENLSDDYFNEAKKTLIQYYPMVKWKEVCVINIKCFG